MNWLQIIAFLVYATSVIVSGMAVYGTLAPSLKSQNRALLLGEIFLLGSIVVVGEMLACSLLGLYKGCILWALVLFNFSVVFSHPFKITLNIFTKQNIRWDFPLVVFLSLVTFFLFRNCFFLIDVDSHSTYLFAQKLWLEHGSSIFASPALDMRVMVPHFNAVPYALGIALFGQETLFAQLVVASWTVVVVLLVFGFLSYRFNRVYGVAGAMLCLFNDHMFYSGANSPVIINSALIAFLFATTYSFLESARRNDAFRLLLAFIFASQLIANKLQVVYVAFLLCAIGMVIQPNLWGSIKIIYKQRRWVFGLCISVAICLMWLVKNFFATGNPFFPALAGELKTLNWSKAMATTFIHYFPGPMEINLIFKYLSYLFIWSGVNALKLVWLLIVALPFCFLFASRSKAVNIEEFREVCFWLSICIIIIVGTCMASFPDPRMFRYGIAVMAVATIFSLDFILKQCFHFHKSLASLVILVVAFQGWGILKAQGGDAHYPTIAQNCDVLLNRLHMRNILPTYYPSQETVVKEFEAQKEQLNGAAWDAGIGGVTSLSAFLLPTLPQIGIWHTSTVSFDSYADAKLVEQELRAAGIIWVLGVSNGHLNIESIQQYAKRAQAFERFPKTLFYNYGFPDELIRIKGR